MHQIVCICILVPSIGKVDWQRYNTLGDGRITQYMNEVACIYTEVPQQKPNNVCLETSCKQTRRKKISQTFVCKKAAMKTRTVKLF